MDAAVIGLVAGSGWASGVNLYGVVALLGLLGRSGFGTIPDALMRTDVIAIALGMFILEFVADKIPIFDSLWDAVHTVVRPMGAMALGALLTGEAETWQQVGAALGSGGLATASHVAKATTRLAINTSPEPASNVAVSLLEDGLVAGVIWFAVTNPVIALGLVVLLLIAGAVLTLSVIGFARRGLRARRERRAQRDPTSATGLRSPGPHRSGDRDTGRRLRRP
jgi:hypothetical protein